MSMGNEFGLIYFERVLVGLNFILKFHKEMAWSLLERKTLLLESFTAYFQSEIFFFFFIFFLLKILLYKTVILMVKSIQENFQNYCFI